MSFCLENFIKIKDSSVSFHLIYGLYLLVEFVRSYVFFLSEDFSVLAHIFGENKVKSDKHRKSFICR